MAPRLSDADHEKIEAMIQRVPMAEALGVASSVIAVVELSAKIFSLCLRYSRDVKNAKGDIERLREEVATFQTTAKELLTLVEGPRGKELKVSQQLTSAIEDGCSRARRSGETAPALDWSKDDEPYRYTRPQVAIRKQEVKGTIEDVERCRGTISLSLDIDQMSYNNTEPRANGGTALHLCGDCLSVCRYSQRRNPQTRLKTVLDQGRRSHGSQLEQTYAPILRSQIIGLPKEEGEEVIKDFKVVVGSIITLANPLSVAALSRLIDIHPDTADERLDALHSVLSIPLERTVPVRLLHLSFRDYLVDSENKEMERVLGGHEARPPKTGRKLLACHAQWLAQLDERIPPELQYACMYWVYRQTKVDLQPNDMDDMYDFLKTHFLHWLEALSLIGRISESIGFIDELQSIVDAEKGTQVLSFLHDAQRFVLKYRGIIDTAPLQVYASALVFAPMQSIVRQTFEHYIPRWISLPPKVDANWNAVLQTLEGHTRPVNSVVFSKDDKFIASGSDDGTIKIWNVATGEEEQTLEGHTDSVTSVVFSNDDKLIASGSYDKMVKIWNVVTGTNLKIFDTGQFTEVLSFTDDDSVLVTSAGRFSLGFPDISVSQPSESEPKLGNTEAQGEVDPRLGFGINRDRTWITAGGPDGRNVLWLPPDFRPGASATLIRPSGSGLVIGCPSGRVIIMGFREASFSDEVR
ncbi:vegetative incompatibility protein het-e-1 [Fusarium bulbicola]|nr:vegetative incompatibility protein het-e-1 [Fusarium bulbicola]